MEDLEEEEALCRQPMVEADEENCQSCCYRKAASYFCSLLDCHSNIALIGRHIAVQASNSMANDDDVDTMVQLVEDASFSFSSSLI